MLSITDEFVDFRRPIPERNAPFRGFVPTWIMREKNLELVNDFFRRKIPHVSVQDLSHLSLKKFSNASAAVIY